MRPAERIVEIHALMSAAHAHLGQLASEINDALVRDAAASLRAEQGVLLRRAKNLAHFVNGSGARGDTRHRSGTGTRPDESDLRVPEGSDPSAPAAAPDRTGAHVRRL